jgi:HlyD family secretion protein
MKRVIPVLILLAAAIAAGVYFYPRLIKKPEPANQLTLSGNIEAHESLVGFKVEGRIVDLPVEEVEQGTLLARLDDADYKQKVRIDEAGVRVRESDLALTLAGTREQEVKASRQSMLDAQADLDEKKIDNDRARQLFAKDEVSAQDRDLATTALKRAEAVFKAAQQRYNEAVEGSRKEDIAIARANLNQSSADLGLSRINLNYTTLYAPSTGVITVRQAELGEVVALAAGVYRRDRPGQHSLGPGSDNHHRYLSRQAVPRAHLIYLIQCGIHTEERADLHGTGHACLSDQDRYRQSES